MPVTGVAVFSTARGWMGVTSSVRGIRRVALPRRTERRVWQVLGMEPEQANLEPFADIIRKIRDYFSGLPIDFTDDIDMAEATPFQQEVWQATCCIPYGQTRSYGWLAEHIGKPIATRAVGKALGENPVPLMVPCHRVIRTDGSIGGFSAGLTMKRNLLALEGVHVR